MNKDILIKKWLDNNLSPKEQKAFESLEDYKDLMQLTDSLKRFKSPNYDLESEYAFVASKIASRQTSTYRWLKPLLRIAAVLLLGFSIFYYTINLDTTINTLASEQTTVHLPDASTVKLNAMSTISFNKNKWDNKRELTLDGEAFFKVAKGSKFDVITKDGVVSVLGTQFNVKQRHNYFEVTCYEGLVAVTHKGYTIKLKAGNAYRPINNSYTVSENKIPKEPSWLHGESRFVSVPLSQVISELERQYNIKIATDNVNTKRLFSGSFTHTDLDLAIKAVILPLNLTYIRAENSIVIKGE